MTSVHIFVQFCQSQFKRDSLILQIVNILLLAYSRMFNLTHLVNSIFLGKK